MHVVSLEYLLWMGGVFCVYWLTPARWRQLVLAALTFVFLLLASPESAAILGAFTLATVLVARVAAPGGKLIAAVALAFIAVLVHFKLGAAGQAVETIVTDLLIPLGLSYYTFRCLHLLFERYRGRHADATATEIVGYLFFLPTLMVGPIHRFGDYQRDVHRVRLDRAMWSGGLERIVYGYVKIGFLANVLVNGVLGGYLAALPPEQEALRAYLWIAQGGLNLYFQFSGFADIAIGFSRLLGFRVMENFNWPFLQRNISAYWRAWHISLTRWCREYVYTTVVSYARSPALGALATLIVIGLWHEISWRYLAWGVYHGLGLIVWQRFQTIKPHLPKLPLPAALVNALSVLFTLHFVWFGFAIVRLDHFSEVWDVWKNATLGFLP